MNEILEKYSKKIQKNISKVNKYSNKGLNKNSKWLIILSIFTPIIILKLARPMMIKLPSEIFYVAVILTLIEPFIIVKSLHIKYIKKINKNLKAIYKNLEKLQNEVENIDDEYKEKANKKITETDTCILVNSVTTEGLIYEDKMLEYEFKKNSFQEKENITNKEIFLDNEEKVKYLEESISIIEDAQNSLNLKKFEDISWDKLIDKYLPEGDYKTNIINIKKVLTIIDNYYDKRKQTLLNLKKPLDLGLDGEKFVDEYLKIYEDEIINLSNMRLEVEGDSIENDNILITRKGIFILEVKNIGSSGSYSILVESDGRWIKQFNGRSEVIEFNAVEQNDRHIAILQKFINSKLNRSIQQNNYLKAEGIVVIANNSLDIKNESMQNIYRVSEVYRYINRFDDVLSYEEMVEIKELILKENLGPKKYPVLDYKYEIKNNVRAFSELISKLDYEKQKLSNIQSYLNNCGYMEFVDMLKDSNTLNNILKAKNDIKNAISSKQYSKPMYLSVRGLFNGSDIKINKDKIRVVYPIIFIVIGFIVATSMKLLYLPGNLKLVMDKNDNWYGYVDENDELRIDYKYWTASSFDKESQLAIVSIAGSFGVIDKADNQILKIKYDSITRSYDLFIIELDEKYGIANNSGKIIVKPEYDSIYVHESGLIIAGEIVGEKENISVLNHDGKKVNNKKYDEALYYFHRDYSQGIGIVIDGKLGFINKDGEEIIKPIYDDGKYMRYGLFALQKDDKFGLIDMNGKEILPFEYQNISLSSIRTDDNGTINRIMLKKNNQYGALDPKTRKIISEIKYQNIEDVPLY